MLLVSLFSNFYCFFKLQKPSSSIMKFEFGEQDIKIYCEKSEDVKTVKVDFTNGSYKIGNAELVNKEDIYLISNENRINLSEIGGNAFVINSNGELLYQMVKAEKELPETVFVTPSGKKYHSDVFCAGKTAFGTDLETAELFGRSQCSICFE